ncbi:MAG: dephospho-CoA kinase [Methylophilus sp.]|nr:dephospho-CoA kinase [Methylophilus sp.]
MNVVALTGGIGSGKSEATRIFKALGVPVVDVDDIAHALTAAGAPLVAEIATAFGAEYATKEGALNRPLMRTLVFNQPKARETLNAIMHPAIFEEAKRQLQALASSPYAVLAIPLLQESPRYLPYIQHVLVVDCDPILQLNRVMQRSGLTEQEASKMIAAQASRERRLAMANTVISNNEDLPALQEKIALFHKNYINTCIVSK